MQNRCLIKGVLINLVGQKEKIKRIDTAHKGTLQAYGDRNNWL